jgi:glucose-6-phosphate isomerase
MNTTPPTDCPAWAKLAAHAEGWRDTHLAELFRHDAQRGAHFGAQAPGVLLDYSRQRVGALALRLLAQLAGERGLEAWRRALFAGESINVTEERAVRHSVLRAGSAAPPEVRAALE